MKTILLLCLIAILNFGCSGAASDSPQQSSSASLPRVRQALVAPPLLPEHEQVAPGGPRVVQVRLVAQEKDVDIGHGVRVQALTFNGTIPGPIIVVHQGDYLELTLENPATNQLRHTIDLHAATGAMGGAALMKVDPGGEATMRFKAIKAGAFVYHCAPGGAQIPYHVVSGMNGAILVLPRDGLKGAHGNPARYNRAYYIGEQDFYVPRHADGSYRAFDSPLAAMPEVLKSMRALTPTHVVFNGAAGALTGKNALTAKVGERVLFIHSQANRDSRPHLIGGHADLVWPGGSFANPPLADQETWTVPGGSAAVALYRFRQPGTYAYLNHNLIESLLLGAVAHIQVSGEWNDELMTQVARPHRSGQ